MVNSLLIFLGLILPDCPAHVAVRASYVLHTRTVVVKSECCGQCRNGKVVHGDGHVTDCPCPPDCKCKAVTHPPTVLKAECKDGKCSPRK
jgi:hypothetical protein